MFYENTRRELSLTRGLLAMASCCETLREYNFSELFPSNFASLIGWTQNRAICIDIE